MDFWQTVEQRYSVRGFDAQAQISSEVIERLLETATKAPSAGNRQPWHFYVVRNEDVRRQLAAAAHGQSFIAQAPVAIVVCTNPEQSAARYGDRGRDLYCLQDTAAAVEHILLGVVALGLGSCWVGAFDESEAAKALDLPPSLRPVAILPIGMPARPSARRTTRKGVGSVTTYID
jgi:nitroreductase